MWMIVGVALAVGVPLVLIRFVQNTDSAAIATPTPARHADLFGQADVHFDPPFASDGRIPAKVGPATVQMGQRVLNLPAGTPLYGSTCAVWFFGNAGHPPCFVQVGIAADGQTITWIMGFYVNPDGLAPGAFPTTTGQVQTVSDTELVLFDGATIPLAANTATHCVDRADASKLAGALVRVQIDTSDGHATGIDCIYRG